MRVNAQHKMMLLLALSAMSLSAPGAEPAARDRSHRSAAPVLPAHSTAKGSGKGTASSRGARADERAHGSLEAAAGHNRAASHRPVVDHGRVAGEVSRPLAGKGRRGREVEAAELPTAPALHGRRASAQLREATEVQSRGSRATDKMGRTRRMLVSEESVPSKRGAAQGRGESRVGTKAERATEARALRRERTPLPHGTVHELTGQAAENTRESDQPAGRRGEQPARVAALHPDEPAPAATAPAANAPAEPMELTHHNRKVHHAAAPTAPATDEPSPVGTGPAGAQPIAFRGPAERGGGRLVMPAALKGSHEILVHQNVMADQLGLERVQDDEALLRMRAARTLVAIPVSAVLVADERLPVDRRYTRPWAAAFLTAAAKEHAARFGGWLQVNSAVRTVDFQVRLMRTNGNAAPATGETRSPHLTGQAIDIAKKGMSPAEVAWMRGFLTPLIAAGKIDVEEEFQQSCFHISVYPAYAPGTVPKQPAPLVRATTVLAAGMLP